MSNHDTDGWLGQLSHHIDTHYAASAFWMFAKRNPCPYDSDLHTLVAHELLCGPHALVAA